MKKIDEEYYVMDADGANNHPLLTWGSTSSKPFAFPKKIEDNIYELPLKVWFKSPYLKNPEMVDVLFVDGKLVMSKKVKSAFDNIYGVRFLPVQIITNKEKIIEGYFAFHPWNTIAAVDKNNYEGSLVDEYGEIDSLEKFSLDKKVLNAIPLEKRLVFRLAESSTEKLIHKSIYEVFIKENVTGFSLIKVSEWGDDAMFN